MYSYEAEHSLTAEKVNRYSRQILVKEIGPHGQQKLSSSSVLLIGAGGLGCPVALYCAGAGIGRIGIIEGDNVEIHNLHRQIAYSESSIGKSKADEIKTAINRLNESTIVKAYSAFLDAIWAVVVFAEYDVVVDCSDNPSTRYLVNDTCALLRIPLVSGSAVGWEGQLTVCNFGKECPCYRCIFPQPPSTAAVTNCSESGVVGPVVGVIASMQANEVIKILATGKSSYAGRLFLFDGLNGSMKTIQLRPRDSACVACNGTMKTIDEANYVTNCCSQVLGQQLQIQDNTKRSQNPHRNRVHQKFTRIKVRLLKENDRLSPKEFACTAAMPSEQQPLLIDIRPHVQFLTGHLRQAKNIPLEKLYNMKDTDIINELNASSEDLQQRGIVVICRRGNDSQLAVLELRKKFSNALSIKDIEGGYFKWEKTVDQCFPVL